MIVSHSIVAHLAAARDKIPDDMPIPEGYMLVEIKEYVLLKEGKCPTCVKSRIQRTASQKKWRQKTARAKRR